MSIDSIEVSATIIDVDSNENNPESIPMKITDVIDDCLDLILSHLDMKNLFSVALANAKLAKIAKLVFKLQTQISSMADDSPPSHCFRSS